MNQAQSKFTKGRSLSDDFIRALKGYDNKCDAVLDDYYVSETQQESKLILPITCRPTGAIHISSERKPGIKMHEITVCRQIGETTPALERRTLAKLKECDVWRRFGKDADAYADYLDNHDDNLLKKLEEESHDKRVGELLDEEGDSIKKAMKDLSQMVGIGAK